MKNSFELQRKFNEKFGVTHANTGAGNTAGQPAYAERDPNRLSKAVLRLCHAQGLTPKLPAY